MRLTVKKSHLEGSVVIPGSKSHTIRATAIASLANGKSVIRNPLVSNDTLSAVTCYRAFGAEIDISNPDIWEVSGVGGRINIPAEIVDIGNSGTTLNIAVGSAALADTGTIRITGDSQTRNRTIAPLLAALTDLGARAVSLNNNGKAPVEISGPLSGGKTALECFTSQYLSSLLLAAPLAGNNSEISVLLLNEPDYVKMTLNWLDKQGIKYHNDNMRKFVVAGGQKYKAFDAVVPADFSSATFFLCAGAFLDADITLKGLDFTDSQPDKAVIDYLRRMGADISVSADSARVRNSKLRGVEIDMNKTPDALPAMAVTGAFAKGETRLVNVKHARAKETDRIKCMAEELGKLGASAQELDDGLVVRGSALQAAQLDGRGDHRIIMSLSLAGMALEEPVVIDTAEAINVTFPDYVSLMRGLGADMKLA